MAMADIDLFVWYKHNVFAMCKDKVAEKRIDEYMH